MSQSNRNTICVEDAEVLQHLAHPDDQFVLRLHAPGCAARAVAGSFLHIRCAAELPMRRPLSIMRARPEAGWVEVLYKTIGHGLTRLSALEPGDTASIIGPIGNGFTVDPDRTPMLIGGGVGIPPLIFLAEQIAARHPALSPVAFFGSEIQFPFDLVNAATNLPGVAAEVQRSLAWIEELGIPCRLASHAGYDGCFEGFVTDLARAHLDALPPAKRDRIQIYACGPEPMLEAVARLARDSAIPSQLCLEEFMACAVGGCAGCGVKVQTPDGTAMKRVCVDGPVFDGASVYPG